MCSEQDKLKRTPGDITYKDAQPSYGTSGGVTCALWILSPSPEGTRLPISACGWSRSVSVISVFILFFLFLRIESSQRRDDGAPPSLSALHPKSWEWRPMRVERKEQDASCCVFIFHKRSTRPKEEETLRRCSSKMLFISIMRARERREERVRFCVYFFDNQNPLPPNGRRNGVSVAGQEIHLPPFYLP